MRKIISEAACLLLILLFGYAAVSKLAAHSTFTLQLSQSPFIESYAPLLTWAVPGTELLAVVLLIFKRTKLDGLYLSLFLMTAFTAYIYAMLHYSYYIPCSCGGVLALLSWKAHLGVNVYFTALAIAGILAEALPRTRTNDIGELIANPTNAIA